MIGITKKDHTDIEEIMKIREHILHLEGADQIENKNKSNFNNKKKLSDKYKYMNDYIFLCTRQGSIIDGNQPLLDLLGYTIEEFFGMNITDLCINPLDGMEFLNTISEKGYVVDHKIKFRKHSGKEIDCMLTGTIRWYNEDNLPDNRPLFKVWATVIR